MKFGAAIPFTSVLFVHAFNGDDQMKRLSVKIALGVSGLFVAGAVAYGVQSTDTPAAHHSATASATVTAQDDSTTAWD
jgi:hypothetical protein